MSRRKAAEVEILSPEDDQSPKGRKRLVDAEHTIKYSAPVPVTVEEDETEESNLFLDDDIVDIEKKRKRKTAKTERDELRKKMMSHGVTAASPLKLIIERYMHSDGPDSGTTAEKSHCTKYGCDEAHILNQDYMNTAARWGAGRYWFTLYKEGTIVTQWEKRLEEPSRQITPTIQHINPNDPNSPTVIYQTNADGQQVSAAPSLRDIMKAQKEAFKEQLEMAKLMREAYGLTPEASQQQPKSEDEILANAILKQPDVIESVVGSVVKRFGGRSGGDDDTPWYADIVRKAVESGQAAQIVQVAIDRIFNGVNGLFPGRQNNGQAPMGQTQVQTPHMDNPQHSQQPHHEAQGTMPQAQLQGASSIVETGANASPEQQQITPAEQALATVISDCQKKIPPQVTFANLMSFADAVNDRAPAYSIDGWIEYFAGMPIDAALEFVKSQPNGEAVVSLPHAKDWTAELQRLIKESQEGDEE